MHKHPDRVLETIEAIGAFMAQTNEIIAKQQLDIENLRLDLEKTKKSLRKIIEGNNSKPIISP